MLGIGSIVGGKYRILNQLGQGGMSVVYLAVNEQDHKAWALKEICKDGVQDLASVRQELIAETSILKSLKHRCLPAIADVLDEGDAFLIVMDYIQGKSLDKVLQENLQKEQRPIPFENVMDWGRQLCELLYYLHSRPEPIIYRDLKPSNIMLRPDGDLCVIDFGTARIFKMGNSEDTTCLGTPGYAAPEQYGGNGQTTPQTDIYNLGATLHHLVTGRNPSATPFHFPLITECRPALLKEVLGDEQERLLGFERIIERCTRYEMSKRYSSCLEVEYDLLHPQDLSAPYRKKQKKKMALFVGCTILGVLFGVISLGAFTLGKNTQVRGYEYYLEEAAVSTTTEGKLEDYRSAIALDPADAEAWLLLLECLLEDQDFSDAEDAYLTAVLNARDGGREKENKYFLQTNQSGYVEFSYQLGLAYYYSMGENGDKSSAVGWFQNVIDADMEALDFGENDAYKYAWQARASILGRISDYYANQLGVINQAGDEEVSYGDYWQDLMSLLSSDLAGKDNVITELRLYNEIVYQIYTHTEKFKEEADISQEEMEQALFKISELLDELDIEENTQALELKSTIETNMGLAERMIGTIFSDTSS